MRLSILTTAFKPDDISPTAASFSVSAKTTTNKVMDLTSYLLKFSLEPVLLAIKHGHHRTWTCFTAAGAIVRQIP
jgi:hypothetical protein